MVEVECPLCAENVDLGVAGEGAYVCPYCEGEFYWEHDEFLDKANEVSSDGPLRERFNILESSTYASPRITMTNDSVGVFVESPPAPLFVAIIVFTIGIITLIFGGGAFLFSKSLGFFIFWAVIMIVLFVVGGNLLWLNFLGDKWLFIHETHLEFRYEKSEKGIPEEYKHILHSDVVKIISQVRVMVNQGDHNTTYTYHPVTSMLVYNADELERVLMKGSIFAWTDIPSSSKEESDAIAAALNFLILATPLPLSVE
jgi:hypothetical protein